MKDERRYEMQGEKLTEQERHDSSPEEQALSDAAELERSCIRIMDDLLGLAVDTMRMFDAAAEELWELCDEMCGLIEGCLGDMAIEDRHEEAMS